MQPHLQVMLRQVLTCGSQQCGNYAFHCQGFVDNLPESQGQREAMILPYDAGLFSSV